MTMIQNAQDLYKALLGTKARESIRVPGTDITIDIRVLTTREMMLAISARTSYLKTLGLENDSFANSVEHSAQICFRSVLRESTDSPLFTTIEEVRNMPSEIVAYIAEQCDILSVKINPTLKDLTEEEVKAYKKKLLNGESLNGLSYYQLASLCRVLAQSLATFEPPVELSSDATVQALQTSNSSFTQASTSPSSQTSSPEQEKAKEKMVSLQKGEPFLQVI